MPCPALVVKAVGVCPLVAGAGSHALIAVASASCGDYT